MYIGVSFPRNELQIAFLVESMLLSIGMIKHKETNKKDELNFYYYFKSSKKQTKQNNKTEYIT